MLPRMTSPLDLYLERRKESTSDFAERCGCDRATISRIRRGLQQPTLDMARKIVAACDGELDYSDLFLKNGKKQRA
jgi:transcriptional regulator with XRE-family HTH domain